MGKQSAYILGMTVVFLAVIGIVMLSSTGAYAPELPEDQPYYAVERQVMWLGLGLVACIIGTLVDYRIWGKFWYVWYAIAVVLLVLCFHDTIGRTKNGSSRWVGFGSVEFQPSEVARLAVVIAMASWFGINAQKIREWGRGFFIPIAIFALPMCLIAREVDLGCSMLVGGSSLIIMFIAGSRWWALGGLCLLGIIALICVAMLIPERMGRLNAYMNLDDPKVQLDDGYQQHQGILALGAGGINGRGLGGSRQKTGWLPYAHTDFIFPILGEELGLRMTLPVVTAFSVFVLCGLFIAGCAPDVFGRLLGVGIVALIGLQAAINLGVTTALLPNTGMPLPLISYGGSNAFCCLAGIGILFNIYRKGIATRQTGSVSVACVKVDKRSV